MPRYSNRFDAPEYRAELIRKVDDDSVVGEIRISPVTVKWRPKNKGKYYGVPLDKFVAWITDDATKARRTKS